MKSVLITGATGMIGQKLRAHLAASGGYEMRLLCLNPSADPQVMTADLATYDETWARRFEEVDAVIHLAGAPSPASTWAVVQRDNIDLSLNVFRAAERHGARRVIFASSNWVMAGHRFDLARLTTDLAPNPINPYGAGKLFIERAGLDLHSRAGISFIALRIGFCQHTDGNIPGPHMAHGLWGQQMWLSDRDLCTGFERAVLADDVGFAVLNLMSQNVGMRWDLAETERVIGYRPQDGHTPVSDPAAADRDEVSRAMMDFESRFRDATGAW